MAKEVRDSPRILAVWTRDLDNVECFGRISTARAVRDVLATSGSLVNARVEHILERPLPTRLAAALGTFLLALICGRPLPLQCAIFAGGGSSARYVLHQARHSDVVYVDGIRTLPWLRRLRRQRLQAPIIVVDLDDLMSRRYEELLAGGLPLSLGYIEKNVPRALARLIGTSLFARAVLSYERATLRRAEREIMTVADRVVLVNAHEAFLLADRTARMRPCATIVTIPPPVHPVAASTTASNAPPGWRAVFVGSDALVQNRLTIDYLLDLWERAKISMPLFLYGSQKRPPRTVPNVVWAGYVHEIAEAYRPGSILLCPGFLRGGIKTKVLEAFAHGVPVVGNVATFEGLSLPDYPLCFEEESELLKLIATPARYAQKLACAAEVARRYLVREHNVELFRKRWSVATRAVSEEV
jgi:glycosyltransferase involved in cell wall biosynthesis